MELKDPTGWTVENNPNKWQFPVNEVEKKMKGYVWQDYMEFDENGMPIKCHACLIRAKGDNGNCINNGEYFICLPKKVREGKAKLVVTKQVKLL